MVAMLELLHSFWITVFNFILLLVNSRQEIHKDELVTGEDEISKHENKPEDPRLL